MPNMATKKKRSAKRSDGKRSGRYGKIKWESNKRRKSDDDDGNVLGWEYGGGGLF